MNSTHAEHPVTREELTQISAKPFGTHKSPGIMRREMTLFLLLLGVSASVSHATGFTPITLRGWPDGTIWIVSAESQTPATLLDEFAETGYSVDLQSEAYPDREWGPDLDLYFRTYAGALVHNWLFPATAFQHVDNEVKLPFTVSESGRYRIVVPILFKQRVSSVRGSITGMSRPSWRVTSLLAIYDKNGGGPFDGLIDQRLLAHNEYVAGLTEAAIEAGIKIFITVVGSCQAE